MLDGCCKQAGSVIVGQNWGPSTSPPVLEEEDEEGSSSRNLNLNMVDMIQAHQQQRSLNNAMEMRIHPQIAIARGYNPFNPAPDHAAAGGSGYYDQSWRGYQQEQNPGGFQQLLQQRYPIMNFKEESGAMQMRSLINPQQQQQQSFLDENFAAEQESMNRSRHFQQQQQPDLKILFPKAESNHMNSFNGFTSSSNLKIKTAKNNSLMKDEDGEDLLSLRPPNSSAHSEITNASSSPENSVHNMRQQQQQQQQHHRPQQHQIQQHSHELKLSRFGCSTASSSLLIDGDHQQQQHQKHQQPLGLELLNMLLECAKAVNRDDLDAAMNLLTQLKQGASIYGDSMQRLAAHFSEGLASRILRFHSASSALKNRSPAQLEMLHSLILQKHQQRSSSSSSSSSSREDDYLAAFTALYTVSPFFKLAHFTANQAIVEAVEGHDSVHVIDLDIMQGFQWPSFIQALKSRPQGPPSLLKLTGIGSNPDALRDTGNRLSSFAATLGVPFRFQPLVAQDLEQVNLGERIEPPTPGEAIAVNAVFHLHRLLNRPAEALKLEKFLRGLKRLQPQAVTIVEQEAAHNAPSFIARFIEALHYYAAVFDSLDASLPQRNEERVRIEQVMFARQIRNIVSCEGEERIERHEKMGFWSSKLSDCGFAQMPLSSHSVSQAKLLLQLCPCEGYRIVESPCDSWPVGSISLAWQDRLLLTASTWACSSDAHF